jgi:hypothetical protein
MEEIELKEIILKLDRKTVDYLSDEVRRKRTTGTANTFSDLFLIRLTEALNKGNATQVFKVKENQPAIRNYTK